MCASPRAPPPERAKPIRGAPALAVRCCTGSAAHGVDERNTQTLQGAQIRSARARMCFDSRIMPHPLSTREKDSRLVLADASSDARVGQEGTTSSFLQLHPSSSLSCASPARAELET